ncbi:MAG: rhodanese-like domain-containing protein [Acidobacteriota bacterium]
MKQLRRLLVGVAALLALGAVVLAYLWLDLKRRDAVDRLAPIKQKVRTDFPEVPQLSVDALAAMLERQDPEEPGAPLLLDVREPEEFVVSHLPGALRVDPRTADSQTGDSQTEPLPEELTRALDAAVATGRPIVAYCSVGYRSSRLAAALRARGVEAVNLEGSIFEWAARGESLVGPGGETTRVVHPYSPAWSWLVDEELRAYEPSTGTGAGSSK